METNTETMHNLPRSPERKRDSFWMEIIKFSILALIIVLPIRFFVAQPFIVSGASMEPTFESGEYLIIDELSYRFELPKRGEVIIFRYPKDPSKFFIKRIIGLPGETLELRGKDIYIRSPFNPDGFKLNQSYLTAEEMQDAYLTVMLSNAEYFVMGDNRAASSDSRLWGALPAENIIGRALIRVLPLTKIGLHPGDANTSAK